MQISWLVIHQDGLHAALEGALRGWEQGLQEVAWERRKKETKAGNEQMCGWCFQMAALKSEGRRTEPWGMPQIILELADKQYSLFTTRCPSVRSISPKQNHRFQKSSYSESFLSSTMDLRSFTAFTSVVTVIWSVHTLFITVTDGPGQDFIWRVADVMR